MPTFRERIAGVLLGPEIKRLRSVTESMIDAYQSRPVSFPGGNPAELFNKLRETVDDRTIELLLRQINYTEGSINSTAEEVRLSIIRECRSLRLFDPITQFSIELWTDYGFQSKPQITPKDENARRVWLEFWGDTQNQYLLSEREIQNLSNELLTDGELFFVFFISRLDGKTIIRTIPTEEIKEVIYSPFDKKVPVFYRREFTEPDSAIGTIYYRDWRAAEAVVDIVKKTLPVGARIADEMTDGETGTDVLVLSAAFRKINGRGWPLLTAGVDWSRVYRSFLKDRAAVAKMAATFTEKIKVNNAGTRAVDALRARLSSTLSTTDSAAERNPVPAAGSTWIENDQLTREWMNRPTNAGDAEKDGIPLLTQAGLAAKIYPHYLGRGDYYRLATASALEGPVLKSFNRYQAFWSSVWQDIARIVLSAAMNYGREAFASIDVDVSQDNILTTDLDNARMTGESLSGFFDRGLVSPTVAEPAALEIMRVMMQGLGIDSAESIISDNPETNSGADPGAIDSGDNEEARVGGKDFPFLVESADGYKTQLRSAFRGLWTGALTAGDFADALSAAVNRYLKEAFLIGLKEGGIDLAEDEIDEDSAVEMFKFIEKEEGYIDGVTGFVVRNNKAGGGKWSVIENRLNMWARGWERARGAGLQSAKTNPALTWREGDTLEKCRDCLYADGKTYRAKTWKKWGWSVKSHKLKCHGFNCECTLEPEGLKPLKGHPRRL